MTNDNTTQAGGFMRLPEILKIIPVGRSTWWAGVKSGRFPKAVKIGARTTAWRVEDIQALVRGFLGETATNADKVASGSMAPGSLGHRLAISNRSADWVKRIADDRDSGSLPQEPGLKAPPSKTR